MKSTKRRNHRAAILALLSALGLSGMWILARPPVVKAATTWTVTSSGDSGGICPGANCTLRQAIATAASGDTINFAAGLTTINLTSAELLIDKNLTISGPGANLLTVQRIASSFRIVEIASGNFIVDISGVSITQGISGTGGGGILNNATLTLNNTNISGNYADSGAGGIQNDVGTVVINNSTVSGNIVLLDDFGFGTDIAAGGIVNFGTVSLTNTTVSGNSARSSTNRRTYWLGGGGIANFGTVNLFNGTISNNFADQPNEMPEYCGGISNYHTVNATNTIIALNSANVSPPGVSRDFRGTLHSGGFNLINDTSLTIITGTETGNQLHVNPLLGPLQFNGGPTQTQALLCGSPAIDKGNSSGSATDQRGFSRPVDNPGIPPVIPGGDNGDIGAYEMQVDLVTNNNDSGAGSLRSVIANACAGSTITFDMSPGKVVSPINLTSGELLINKSLTINGPGANLLSVSRSSGAFRIFEIAQTNSNVTISGITIANGSASGALGTSGGGIFNQSFGLLTITDCAIRDNTATGSGDGGAIFNIGTVLLNNSTINGNSALNGNGGGVFNLSVLSQNSTVTITNSTISDNHSGGLGGGIYTESVIVPNQPVPISIVNLANTTVSANSAQIGGGIGNSSGGTVNAANTLIALNTVTNSGPDFNGVLTSQGYNLIGNASGATISPAQLSDQIGTVGSPINPLLGPLQNNGGSTSTRALLAGSSAIDAGNNSSIVNPPFSGPPFKDQRGFNRFADGDSNGSATVDIGAYERQGVLMIDSASPPAGRTAGGQQITLYGAFTNLSTVTMGGAATSWSYTNPGDINAITVTTPAHAAGAVQIDLTPTSGSVYLKTNAFAYLPTVFTDDMIMVGQTTAKAKHIIELRQAVDALRAVAGLSGAPWTDPGLTAGNAIKAVHILNLRTYLDDAATRLGYSTSAYTDPGLTSGFMIKRIHIEDLRQRIRTIAG